MGRSWVFLCGFAWLLAACESADERLRSDARAFLGLHEAVDHRSSEAEREKRVAALEALLLADESVRRTRDLCVSGNREADKQRRAQEANAAEIERAIAAKPNGEPLDAQVIARLTQKLEASDEALRRAHEQLKLCEEQARSLSLRFGPR